MGSPPANVFLAQLPRLIGWSVLAHIGFLAAFKPAFLARSFVKSTRLHKLSEQLRS